jgi:hypothetical protein
MRRLPVLAALLLCACATPYQPKGFAGGYSEERLAPGHYFLSVQVNGYTSPALAEAYWHRRAAEVCAAEGAADHAADITATGRAVRGEVRCLHASAQ